MNNKSNNNKKTLREAIRKEIKQALNEGSKENKIADLYAYAGIQTKYSDKMIERYGQAIVDQAIQMAPKIIAFQKKLKDIAKEIKTSPEGKMLMLIAKSKKGYRGDNDFTTIGDVFDI